MSLKYSEAVKEITSEYTLSELAEAAGIEYLYNGQYGVSTDGNGLYYMRARYYDQCIKRFINRDVLSGETENPQSLNRYAYVQGNPVSLTDPFGLCLDSSSAFRNFMKGIHDFDWNAAGHMALDVVGFVWDGADWLNAAWYALEGNYEQAAVSALCALPGAGMALGGKMMGSQKLHKAGRLIFAISAGAAGGMGMIGGGSMIKAGVTNIMNGLEEGRIDSKGLVQVLLGSTIACLSGRNMYYNYKGLLSTGDNLARSSRISETASETMESGKGCKGSTNAAEPPSVYGKGHDIETNGFGPDTVINRNANYGAKAADPSYGVANKPIGGYELEINTPSRSSYVTGTSRTGMAAGAEENIWLKAGNGTGVSGTPGRKVPGSLGSTGLDVGKPKVPDVPEIGGKGDGLSTGLSNKAVKHPMNDHMPIRYANQLPHMDREYAERYLKGNTFFNADWTDGQVRAALNLGYKEALNNKIVTGEYTFKYLDENVTVCLENGVFKTGYGDHTFTYDELIELMQNK